MKSGAIAAKMFGMALNMITIFAISKAIQLGIGAIDNLIHAEEVASKKAQEASGKIKELNNSYKSNKAIVDEVAVSYERLSSGIDKANNSNLTLSDDDYQKFLDTSNKLAEIFPELVTGIDKNGNSILNLGKSGKSATVELQELLKAQKDLANYKISLEVDDIAGDVFNKVKKANSSEEIYNDEIAAMDKYQKIINDIALNGIEVQDVISISSDAGDKAAIALRDAYFPAIMAFKNELKNERLSELDAYDLFNPDKISGYNDNGKINFFFDATMLTSDEKAKLSNHINDQARDIKIELNDSMHTAFQQKEQLSGTAELAWKDFIPSIVSSMESTASFNELDEVGRNMAIALVNGLNSSSIAGIKENGVYNYILENIISPLYYLPETEKEKLSKAYSELLSLDSSKMNLKDYENKIGDLINQIASLLGKDPVEMKVTLGFDNLDEFKREVDKISDIDFMPKSKAEMISSINSLKEGFDQLHKISESISREDAFDFSLLDESGFKETFGDLGDSYANFIDIISSSSNNIEKCQPAFDDLLNAWLDNEDALSGISESTVDLTIAMLDQMGVANAEEMVTSALADQHRRLAAEKYYNAGASTALEGATASEIGRILSEAEAAGISSLELARLQLAKLAVNGTQIDTASDIDQIIALANTAGSSTSALYQLAAAKAAISGGALVDPTSSSYDRFAALEGQSTKHKLESGGFNYDYQPLDANKYKKAVYSPSGGGGKSGGGAGGGKGSGEGAAASEKEIDWIDRKLKLLEGKRTQLESKSSSSFLSYLGLDEISLATAKDIIDKLSNNIAISTEEFDALSTIAQKAGMSMMDFYDAIQNNGLESRKGNLASLLKTDTTLLKEYSLAADSYKQTYEKSLDGLSDDIRRKVENGGDDVATYSGDEGEKVQAAIDARDKYLESLQKEADQKEQLVETTKLYYENEIAYLDAQSDRLGHQNSMINAQIDYLTTSGQIVNASSYESLISNLRQQEHIINEKLKQRKLELQALLDTGDVKEGSEEYYELQGSIEDCEASLVDLNTQQEEFRNKLLQLPIDNMDIVIGMYQDMNTAMTNWADETEASGKKVSSQYYDELIQNGMTIIDQYKEQADLIRDVMDEYDVGSENWNTLYSRLQSINSEMSSMVQNLHKWNEALLQMPIDSVSDLSSSLQKALDAMSSLQSDYDTVISAVTGAIKEQIDALNEEKDLINEQKNAQIEVLQTRLELLQQQNEALNLQTSLEQALYNLQSANTQKTEKVIRDGEIVYESNADNIKNAQEEVQDALAALEQYKLSQEIKDLEKELDAINDKYEDQIKQLDKISNKWSEIASKIEQAKNESIADDYLGDGWKDQVLSGNDTALFNTFQGMYQKLSEQMTQYEEQIKSTENIHQLLQDYIQSYKEGNITYEQASKGISDLLSQMNQKMSAMDNLDNVLDFIGTANGSESSIEGVLDGIQSSLTEAAEEILKSFELYNDNAGLISEYTTSWQQLTTNVEDIRDLIEEVRDNLEDVLNDISYDDDEEDMGNGSSSPGVVTPGNPGGSYVTGGGDYVDSGPGARITIEKKHDGIESGLIGDDFKKREAMLQSISIDRLEPNEVYLKALKGEAIFTEEQQRNLLNNFKTSGFSKAMAQSHKQNIVGIDPRERPMEIKIEVGNISLPDVRDVDGFAKAFATNFDSAIRQEVSKKWR